MHVAFKIKLAALVVSTTATAFAAPIGGTAPGPVAPKPVPTVEWKSASLDCKSGSFGCR